MEYLKKDELYKNRGYAKCISCGYRTILDNYKSIFSYTWKSALAFCLVNIIALSITNGFSLPTNATDWVVWSVMIVAVILSMYYFFAHIVNIFTEQGKIPVFKKLLTLFLFGILVTLLSMVFLYVTIIFSYQSEYGSNILMIASAIMAVLLFVLGMPFGYLSLKYVSEDDNNFFKVVKKNYYKGFSHWGLIFLTYILSILFVSAASLVVAMPLYMLVIAKFISDTGVMLGDANGMPSYFPYIFSITTSIISVILIYFKTFIFSTLYYTYGSIEQRENERIGFMEKSRGI